MMKTVPKVVNKLPLYLVLIVLVGVTFFILTGKFKLEVVNVSADSSEASNYIKLSTLDDQTISEILNSQQTIGFVTSDYCSNCDVLKIDLKDFLNKNPNYKVYEFDLDTSRTALRSIDADITPSIIIPTKNATQFEVKSNITVQDLDDIILTELSN